VTPDRPSAASGTRIAFVEALGRRVRLGSWQDQRVSTYRKIGEALAEGRWDDAAALTHYFVDEANVCFQLYRQWIADLNGFLVDRGTPPEELDQVNAGIVATLALPDGRPWNPRREWDRFISLIERTVGLCHRERPEEAHASLDEAKEAWRQVHDRDVDHTYGLMSEVKRRLGESAIAAMYERVLLPLFAWRYDKFDIDRHPWDEGLEVLMLVACEAMRGHLVGPERTGDFELVEEEDRFVLRFDPCGSGQRTVRGDWIEGTPPRMEPPYGWAVSEEEHSWNHYTRGVCLYCAHCIVLMEEMPMDRFGYPVRVIDPPVYPDTDRDPARRQKCQWQMFKDPTAVPEKYYHRVGRTKPQAFGSRAHDAPALPDVTGMPGAG
jgi:hypothetical protein